MIPLILIASLAAAGPYDDGVKALREQRFTDAKSSLEQAISAQDRTVDAYWELGWAHWTLKDYPAAATAWRKVKELDPTHAELEQWLKAAEVRAALVEVQTKGGVVDERAADGQGLSLYAVGDTMMGSDLRRGKSGLPADDGQLIFEPVRDAMIDADITFANLEGPLANGLPSTKCREGSTACYAFRTPTRYTAGLLHGGVDVVSLANNHAMDLGVAGQDATMAALDAAGIAHAGRYGDIASIEVNGLKVAFLAAHSGSCCLNVNEIDEVVGAIALADRDHDLVVLSFHGGAEGSGARHVPGKTEIAWGERRGDLKKLSHAAVDAGADLILGHGPHVLRAMEVYKGRLIAYSLGNFVGYRQFGAGEYTGTSAVLQVELAANGVLRSGAIVPLVLNGESAPVPDPTGRAWTQINELSAKDFPETGVKLSETGTF